MVRQHVAQTVGFRKIANRTKNGKNVRIDAER